MQEWAVFLLHILKGTYIFENNSLIDYQSSILSQQCKKIEASMAKFPRAQCNVFNSLFYATNSVKPIDSDIHSLYMTKSNNSLQISSILA